MEEFPRELFWKYARELEIYHGLFTKLWKIGRPRFVDTIPTACVSFSREGDFIDFQFNKEFWMSLDDHSRLFVICHELLHVILSHGKRFQGLHKKIANVTADCVINEMLVASFGFTRSKIENQKELCWFDTVFPKEQNLDKTKHFEYYYELLKKDCPVIYVKLVEGENGHDGLEGVEDGIADQIEDILDSLSPGEVKDMLDQINQDLKDYKESKDEKSKDKDDKTSKQAGTMAGGMVKIVNLSKIIKKRKWESIIKNWARKHIHNSTKLQDQFVQKNRRYYNLKSKNLLLPSEFDVECMNREKRRVKLLFVLDVSGSVSGLEDRFLRAALSLPRDRFDTQMISFDTRVGTITKVNDKWIFSNTGGGTDYNCVIQYYNQLESKPDVVFTITDLYFSPITLDKDIERKFYWFKTEGSATGTIPKGCKVFDLKDYE